MDAVVVAEEQEKPAGPQGQHDGSRNAEQDQEPPAAAHDCPQFDFLVAALGEKRLLHGENTCEEKADHLEGHVVVRGGMHTDPVEHYQGDQERGEQCEQGSDVVGRGKAHEWSEHGTERHEARDGIVDRDQERQAGDGGSGVTDS